MATKENTTGKETRWEGKESRRRLFLSVLIQAAEGVAFLFLGGVLAGAEVFGVYAPFGVAIVGAAGSGASGFCALLGACLGYLCLQGLVGGLRYGAAAILTFSVAFAFYDMKIYRKAWFMPAVTACLCGITGFICLSDAGWHTQDVVFFATEILFTGIATYFYSAAFSAWPTFDGERDKLTVRQTTGLLVLGATVLIALSGVEILEELSLGRIAAVIAVMLAARRGPNTGTLAGVGAGIAMDLASAKPPYYSMIYAIAGLLSGVFCDRGKLLAALAYVVTNGVAVLWTWDSGMRIGLLYEVFVASVIFLLLPNKIRNAAGQMLAVQHTEENHWDQTRRLVAQHMKSTARAFRELYENLRETFRPDDDKGQDVTVVFERTAERLCRRCALRDSCWQRECTNTYNALNDVSTILMKRGKALPTDFPSYFSNRCLHFSQFLAAVNEEFTAFLYRRQSQNRMRENQAALCQQYAELDHILGRAATELSEDLTPDLPREKKLLGFLRSQGLEEKGIVYYNEHGHLRVETPVSEYLKSEEGRKRLSRLLGVVLREPEELDGYLVFAQAEPFMAAIHAATKCKEGEVVSGDTGTWFSREDGTLCVLLCDGMGSGPAARKESGLAVRLLQSFLKAGVEAEAALSTVNSALSLKGEETGSCTTVDLLLVELFTGQCSVYKYGAAPTYLQKQGKVSSVVGSALPAGVAPGDTSRPDVNKFRAEEGDWIVLMSDGITGGENDEWLRSLLSEYEGTDPAELAGKLLDEGVRVNKGADDGTVIAVRMDKRA